MIVVAYRVIFPTEFQSAMTIFHYPNERFVHLKVICADCSGNLICKKYHSKNHHNGIKYHLTLNTIVSALLIPLTIWIVGSDVIRVANAIPLASHELELAMARIKSK